MAELVAEELSDEIQFKSGAEFEQRSMLGDIMSVSTMINKLQGQLLTDKRYTCFTELPNYPNVNPGDIISCHVSVTISPVTSLCTRNIDHTPPIDAVTRDPASCSQNTSHCTVQDAQVSQQEYVSHTLTHTPSYLLL